MGGWLDAILGYIAWNYTVGWYDLIGGSGPDLVGENQIIRIDDR